MERGGKLGRRCDRVPGGAESQPQVWNECRELMLELELTAAYCLDLSACVGMCRLPCARSEQGTYAGTFASNPRGLSAPRISLRARSSSQGQGTGYAGQCTLRCHGGVLVCGLAGVRKIDSPGRNWFFSKGRPHLPKSNHLIAQGKLYMQWSSPACLSRWQQAE